MPSMLRPLAAQGTVHVDVQYYDAKEREKLRRFPTYDSMEAIVATGIDVPMDEFLTYAVFHKKRLGLPLLKSYDQVALRIGASIAMLEESVAFNGDSICTSAGVIHQDPRVVEVVGEAVGLAVISRIHRLTKADWQPIPQGHGRGAKQTFDYELASDGVRVIELENKGTSVPDNRKKHPNVVSQASKILLKKVATGAVAAVGGGHDELIRCGIL